MIHTVLESPPAGVDFALQKGKGKVYETVQKQRSVGEDLHFEVTLELKPSAKGTDFAGPLVQGPPGQRFFYIDIGTFAGQTDSCWSRRLKIPLHEIPAKRLAAGGTIEIRVPGTGRDGGPTCGTFHDGVA